MALVVGWKGGAFLFSSVLFGAGGEAGWGVAFSTIVNDVEVSV